MEKEVETWKSMQVEVMRINLSLANLSEKIDSKIDALDQNLSTQMESLDKRMSSLDNRLGRMEGWLFGLLTILVGGIGTVIVFPYIKANYF